MSLLLDALKRSEQERQQTLKGRLGHAGPAPGIARARVPWTLAIAVLLCVNVGLILVWMRTPERTAAPAAPAVAATPPAPVEQPRIRSLAREAALAEPVTPPAAEPANTSAPAGAVQPSITKGTAEIAAPAPTDPVSQSAPQNLPPLHMQIHVYSPNPADRFVIINMHRYVEGDRLAEGPKVVQIRRDGVVLRYRGRSFLLPRQH